MNINILTLRLSMATGLVLLQILLGTFVLMQGARQYEEGFSQSLDDIRATAARSLRQLGAAQTRVQELAALEPEGLAADALAVPAGLAPDLRGAYFGLLEQQLRASSVGLSSVQQRSQQMQTELGQAQGLLRQLLVAFVCLVLVSAAVLGLWAHSEAQGGGEEPRPALKAPSARALSPGARPAQLSHLWRAGGRLGVRLFRRGPISGWRLLQRAPAPAGSAAAASRRPMPELEPDSQPTPGVQAEVARACELMQALQSAVQQSGRAMEQARQLSAGLGQQAGRCRTMMGDIQAEMRSLRATAQQIRALVANVDSIAFETQVLAVHAALVEVQSGTADGTLLGQEVQTLARRCTEAARDVKRCVAEAVSQVEARGEQVFATSEALLEIVDSVERLSQITADVSFAGLIEVRALESLGQSLRALEQALRPEAAADSPETPAQP